MVIQGVKEKSGGHIIASEEGKEEWHRSRRRDYRQSSGAGWVIAILHRGKVPEMRMEGTGSKKLGLRDTQRIKFVFFCNTEWAFSKPECYLELTRISELLLQPSYFNSFQVSWIYFLPYPRQHGKDEWLSEQLLNIGKCPLCLPFSSGLLCVEKTWASDIDSRWFVTHTTTHHKATCWQST